MNHDPIHSYFTIKGLLLIPQAWARRILREERDYVRPLLVPPHIRADLGHNRTGVSLLAIATGWVHLPKIDCGTRLTTKRR